MKKYKIVFTGIILITAGFLIYFFFINKPIEKKIVRLPLTGPKLPCPGETLVLKMEDDFMSDVIAIRKNYSVVMNYYACNPLQRGDLIVTDFPSAANPTVKIVQGVEGDRFKLIKNEKKNGWNISINDQVVMYKNEPYLFGKLPSSPLVLYEIANKGVIQKGEVIYLSVNSPGDRDSSVYGVMSAVYVRGKVLPLVPDTK